MSVALVTGCSGFVASRLVALLLSAGWSVVGLDLLKPPGKKHEKFKFVYGDLTNLDDLFEAFEGIDTVFHVASLWKGPKVFDVNVKGTDNVIRACIEKGVKRLIYTSSGSVVFEGKDIKDGDESHPYTKIFFDKYSETKVVAEKLVLEANGKDNGTANGLMTAAVRPHTIYGPGDKLFWPTLIQKAKEGKLKFIIGSGNNLSSYTFVDNCCNGMILAAEKLTDKHSKVCGRAYNINDGVPSKFWEMCHKIATTVAEIPPNKLGTIKLPASLLVGAARVMQVLKIQSDFTLESIALASTDHYYSIQNAKKDLGYEPLDPAKCFEVTAEYFKKNERFVTTKPKSKLPLWLGFVSLLSLFGAVQAFSTSTILQTRQFSLAPDQVTPLTARLFGCWTLVSTLVRLSTAFDVNNKSLYRICTLTFCIALGIYFYEIFVAGTSPLFPDGMMPLTVASISLIWMTCFAPK